MKNNLTTQIIAATATLALAILVLNPFHLWMPTMLAMALLAGLFVVFGVFAVFVMRERAVDEREEQHRSFAGRVAFLTGAILLMLGILVEDLQHNLDPWLVIALAGMIIAKLGARVYSDRHF